MTDFATGKAAMLMWQAAGANLASHGMKPEDYGVAPVPAPAGATGDRATTSMVAGINLAVFRNTRNTDGALSFVKFMTGTEEQIRLNKAYGTIPRPRTPRPTRPSPPPNSPPSPPSCPAAPCRSRRSPTRASSRPWSAPPSRTCSPRPPPANPPPTTP